MTDTEMLSLWGDFDDLQKRVEKLEYAVNDEPNELKQMELLEDSINILQEMLSTSTAAYFKLTNRHITEG